ncbi:MAG: hypothetical protein QOJ29_3831 [Thermoleophilaceae bacterium]|nr:hypothetical protein [Thermoleophilaceae bacterium]
MNALLGPLLTLGALYVLLRVVVTGGWRRSGRRLGITSPTGLLRGRTGPYRYSPRSPARLWSSFALTMVLSTQLISDSALFYNRFAAQGTSTPSTRATVTLLVLVGCLLAAIAASGHRSGNPLLDGLGAVVAVCVALVDPWAGTIAGAVIAVVALIYAGGVTRTALQCVGIAVSYYALSVDGGLGLVTLSVVLTVLMGTLTIMLIALRRTMSAAVVVGIVVAVALVSGLTTQGI